MRSLVSEAAGRCLHKALQAKRDGEQEGMLQLVRNRKHTAEAKLRKDKP